MNSILVTDAAPSVSYPNKPVVKRPFCSFRTEGGAPRGSSSPWPWVLRGGQQRDTGLTSPRPDPMSPKAAPPRGLPSRTSSYPAPCLHGLPSEEPGWFQTSVKLSRAPMQMGFWVPRGLGLEISFHLHLEWPSMVSKTGQNPHARGAPGAMALYPAPPPPETSTAHPPQRLTKSLYLSSAKYTLSQSSVTPFTKIVQISVFTTLSKVLALFLSPNQSGSVEGRNGHRGPQLPAPPGAGRGAGPGSQGGHPP